MSNDYFHPIVDPINPAGERIQAVLPYQLILRYYKYHPVRYENLRAARSVLDRPERILLVFDSLMKVAGATQAGLSSGTLKKELSLLFRRHLSSQST